jgi:hypothetical protein
MRPDRRSEEDFIEMSWRDLSARAGGLGVWALVLVVLISVMAYVAVGVSANHNDFAAAIQVGVDRGRAPLTDAEAAEDDALTGDANEAGYRQGTPPDLRSPAARPFHRADCRPVWPSI